MPIDPRDLAADAGLRYADLDLPALTRRRRGRGFSYQGPRGGRVDDRTRRRIEGLAIPPAWTSVWIASDERSHILAAGTDDAGRRQYLYHPDFREVADEVKFARIGTLGERLGEVRRAVELALGSDDERDRLTALVVRLIDRTLMRVGTDRYAEEHESFGASTLRREHVQRDGDTLTFCFVGKGGAECVHVTDDCDLLSFVDGLPSRRRASGPLFATADGWTVDGERVADWLSGAARLEVTAKDLRTLGASATMVRALCEPNPTPDGAADRDRIVAAFDAVADRLGDTRAVARSSYVAPRIVEAHASGELADAWRSSRDSRWRSRAESTLVKLLA